MTNPISNSKKYLNINLESDEEQEDDRYVRIFLYSFVLVENLHVVNSQPQLNFLKMYSMGSAYKTPTCKVKNVGKMRPELRKTKNDKHKPKKQYAEGFTPPDPSSKGV